MKLKMKIQGNRMKNITAIEMDDRMEIYNERSANSERDWKGGANKINSGNAKEREQIFR
jgi:hypothetical protein